MSTYAERHPHDAQEDWGMPTQDGNAAVAHCAKRSAWLLVRGGNRTLAVASGWVIYHVFSFSGVWMSDSTRSLVRDFLAYADSHRDEISADIARLRGQ